MISQCSTVVLTLWRGKWQNRGYQNSETLNRLIQNLAQPITSAISPRMPKLKLIAPVRVPWQMREILLLVWFLPRDAMLARHMLSSCVRRYSMKKAKRRSRKQRRLVFWGQRSQWNSNEGTKQRWARLAMFEQYLAISQHQAQLWLAAWLCCNGVGRINEVTLHRARLVRSLELPLFDMSYITSY